MRPLARSKHMLSAADRIYACINGGVDVLPDKFAAEIDHRRIGHVFVQLPIFFVQIENLPSS